MNINFTKVIIISIIISSCSFGQNDWNKWGKAENNYQLPVQHKNKNTISRKNIGLLILTSLNTTYSFFISELDGDNCPFYPSCSAFFIESVEETNLIKGFLMFGDRFTRDTNIFKRLPYYPLHISGKLYDPVNNYKLDKNQIKYYPRDIVVK
ncbi:MAG: membrane protein insertion efficiency factor YidD [Bacteroidetes bacterium]|nr:membrane protein insertion efficiency factor YidD [Bacteroidota bacterium]